MKNLLILFLFIITGCNENKLSIPREATQEYIDSTNKVLETEISRSRLRGELIVNALKMGMSKKRAERYGDSIYQTMVTDSAVEVRLREDMERLNKKDSSK